jgi:hypothetical protein
VDSVGGIVGRVISGNIENSYFTGTVTGRDFVGGVVGRFNGTTVTGCYSTGTVSGRSNIGGVVGGFNGTTITGCYSTSAVTGTGSNIGGVAGNLNGGALTNSYSTGAVSGAGPSIGGVVGNIENSGTVANCYSTGAVSGNRTVGGVAGNIWNGSVTNSAALNPSITRASGAFTDFGRVTGYIHTTGATASNNVAFAEMLLVNDGSLSFTEKTATGKDGADIATLSVASDGTIGGRFIAVNGWTTESSRLPGLFGETVPLPTHLGGIFTAVTGITGVPTEATAGTPLILTGTVNPSNATHRTIAWSVFNAGTTGATISGNTLNATAAGTVVVRATIVNGATEGTVYTQNFTITVSAAAVLSYTVTVTGGTGSGNYAMGAVVTVSAGTAPVGQQFVNWTSTPTVMFANANNTVTTFTMPPNAITVTANFEQSTSIATPDREIPQTNTSEEATIIVPINAQNGELTAGPNPVDKQSGAISFFWRGKRIKSSTLTIFDASGNLIKKVRVNDKSAGDLARREVGSWDLTDRRGRPVSDGTYLVRGTVVTLDGKRERVSVVVGVR